MRRKNKIFYEIQKYDGIKSCVLAGSKQLYHHSCCKRIYLFLGTRYEFIQEKYSLGCWRDQRFYQYDMGITVDVIGHCVVLKEFSFGSSGTEN